jgi:hypothetical protein
LPELRFALGSPDVDLTSVDNAATAVEAKSFFIRSIGTDGYRIGPKPKLNKVMSDRRASLDEQRDVLPACLKLVKGAAISFTPQGGGFLRPYRQRSPREPVSPRVLGAMCGIAMSPFLFRPGHTA